MTKKILIASDLPDMFSKYIHSLRELFGDDDVKVRVGDYGSYLEITVDANSSVSEEELEWYKTGYVMGFMDHQKECLEEKLEKEEDHYADFIG